MPSASSAAAYGVLSAPRLPCSGWLRASPAGGTAAAVAASFVTEFDTPTADSKPFRIAAVPDRALWFTEQVRQEDRPDHHRRHHRRVPYSHRRQRHVRDRGRPRRGALVHRAGAPDRDLLVAAFALNAFKSKRGRPLRLRYVATRASAVRLDVLKGRKVIAKASARARKGRNQITVPRVKTSGRFKLRLTAGVDNQTSTDTARLTVSGR